MANLKFQRIAVLLSSLFLGFSVGTIFIFIRPNSLDQDYHLYTSHYETELSVIDLFRDQTQPKTKRRA